MINNLNLKGTCGLYPWFEEDDVHLIYPEDVDIARKLVLHGKVFYCAEQYGEFIRIVYGDYSLRVKPQLFQPVRSLHFKFGDLVTVRSSEGKKGTIINIGWHYKSDEPMYYLMFNGKKSSRRYFEQELEHISK